MCFTIQAIDLILKQSALRVFGFFFLLCFSGFWFLSHTQHYLRLPPNTKFRDHFYVFYLNTVVARLFIIFLSPDEKLKLKWKMIHNWITVIQYTAFTSEHLPTPMPSVSLSPSGITFSGMLRTQHKLARSKATILSTVLSHQFSKHSIFKVLETTSEHFLVWLQNKTKKYES